MSVTRRKQARPQRSEVLDQAYRPDQGRGRVHKDSKREPKRDNKEPRRRANGKPGEGNAGMGSDK